MSKKVRGGYQMSERIPGVHLQVVPTDKFKTTQITIRFKSKLSEEKLNERSLLAAMMENCCAKYPSPGEMNEQLANMYGALFSVDSTRKGDLLLFSLTLTIVNDRFLNGDTQLLAEGFEFLYDVLFEPLVENDMFVPSIVSLEKHHLMNYMAAMVEDKQDYTVMRLQSLYFDNEAQAVPFYGTPEGIEPIEPDQLYRAYKDMLLNDEVVITVIGNVSENEVAPFIDAMPFPPRVIQSINPFYHQSVGEIRAESETQPIVQSKLAMIYQTNIYYGEMPYYPLLVFNGLFGGFPHSKLFMNVRERESMAYYASSHIDAYRGNILVQAGIDAQNRDTVIQLIEEQLESLQNGEFDELAFQQTKAMLINQWLSGQDNARVMQEHAYTQWLFNDHDLSLDAMIQHIQDVTVEEVALVAKQVTLQAAFFLEGGLD